MQEPALHISCFARNLDRKDGLFRKSDPFLVVSLDQPGSQEIYKSEVVYQTLNPTWEPFFIRLSDVGSMTKKLKFNCYDWDEDGGHDYIGSFTASLADLKANSQFQFINPSRIGIFHKKQVSGTLHLSVCRDIMVPSLYRQAYQLTFRAEKLDRKDFAGKSDPFLVFKAKPAAMFGLGAKPHKNPKVVYRTEVIQQNLNPTWKPFVFDVNLCGGVFEPITIECYDWDNDGTHDLIGIVEVTLNDLTMKKPQFPIIHPAKKKKYGYRNSGVLFAIEAIDLPMAPPQPMGYNIHFSATHLDRKDFMGKSDPFILISSRENKSYTLVHKSEVIEQSLNPVWKPITLSLEQCKGLDKKLKIECYDKDKDGQEIIGVCLVTLRELTFPFNAFHLLHPKKTVGVTYKNSGQLVIRAVEPVAFTQTQGFYSAYTFKASAKALDRRDVLGKSDPYFLVYVCPQKKVLTQTIKKPQQSKGLKGANKGVLIHKSNVVLQDLNPVWAPFVLETDKCGGPDGSLKIEVWDQDKNKKDDLIGKCRTSIRELTMFRDSPEIALSNKHKITTDKSGTFRINDFSPAPNAVPYVSSNPSIQSMSSFGGPAPVGPMTGSYLAGPPQMNPYPGPYPQMNPYSGAPGQPFGGSYPQMNPYPGGVPGPYMNQYPSMYGQPPQPGYGSHFNQMPPQYPQQPFYSQAQPPMPQYYGSQFGSQVPSQSPTPNQKNFQAQGPPNQTQSNNNNAGSSINQSISGQQPYYGQPPNQYPPMQSYQYPPMQSYQQQQPYPGQMQNRPFDHSQSFAGGQQQQPTNPTTTPTSP